jgi:hypothetical protein
MNEHETGGLIRETIKKLVAFIGLLILGVNSYTGTNKTFSILLEDGAACRNRFFRYAGESDGLGASSDNWRDDLDP